MHLVTIGAGFFCLPFSLVNTLMSTLSTDANHGISSTDFIIS